MQEVKPGWKTTEAAYTGLGGGALYEIAMRIIDAEMGDLSKGIALAGIGLAMGGVVAMYAWTRVQAKAAGGAS